MVSSKPNYSGIVSNKGNNTELHSPYNIAKVINPNYECTWKIQIYPIAVDITPIIPNHFILGVGAPFTPANINLNAVIEIQYAEL